MSQIVGFLKFSDFKSSNGKAHFQELIKGNVFFQDYKMVRRKWLDSSTRRKKEVPQE